MARRLKLSRGVEMVAEQWVMMSNHAALNKMQEAKAGARPENSVVLSLY